MENKYRYFFISLVLLVILSSNFVSANLEISDTSTEFSDKLKHEPYEPLEQLENFYDGVETFLFDTIQEKPLMFKVSYQDINDNVLITENVNSHKKVMSLHDSDSGTLQTAEYYMLDVDVSNYKTYFFEFWFCLTTSGSAGTLYFYDDSNLMSRIYFSSSKNIIFYDYDNVGHVLDTWNPNVWQHIKFEVVIYDSMIYLYTMINIEVDFIEQYSGFTQHSECSIDKIVFTTKAVESNYFFHIDSLGFNEINWRGGLGGGSWQIYSYGNYTSQIENTQYLSNNNRYNYDSNDYFSFYESIIDKFPTIDNNFRTWFITDNIMNTKYLDNNRLLRLKGSDNTQNKYKIIQLYFDDLDKNDSFLDNNNSFVEFRVDSFDNSENLINMYYFNLTFNQTHGFIYWNAYYRESLAIPKWKKEPTNPVFNFSEYLGVNESLNSLQINAHFFLTYNSTHKLFLIRTEVAFNGRLNQIYSYDKIINAGSGNFYNTQSKIKVQYIDYFNFNNGSDYLGNRFYTYNNLRGIRTLETNSTDYFFNFLNCGFFTDNLEIYIEPEKFDDDDIPEPPNEPEKPKKSDYWKYKSYKIVKDGSIQISNSETIDFYNDSIDIEFDFDYDYVEAEQYTAKFYYREKIFKNKDFGIWKFKFVLDIEVNLNLIRNTIVSLVNAVLLFSQFIMFLLMAGFNYLIMYLIVALIIPFFWNYPIYWIFVLGLNIAFYLYVMLVILLGWLWNFVIWIFENIIIPLFEWFIEIALPIIIEFIVIFLAFILALLIWCLTLCQSDFDVIYNQTYDMIRLVADFLIDSIVIIIENFPAIIVSLLLYIILIGLAFIKELYTKAKGYPNRSLQLHNSIEAYILPFQIGYDLVIRTKEMFARWS